MDVTIATVAIEGISPMTQSKMHSDPKLAGELADAYDMRTWRSKLNVSDDGKSIVIPAVAVHQALVSAAKYSKQQIPGQGKATWTAKFQAGIMLMESPRLNIDPESVGHIVISANSDGVRGSGKRVARRFPIIPTGWRSEFQIYVIDPIITRQVMADMLEKAGLFIGLGQFRPQNGGTNGRFRIVRLDWQDATSGG